MCWTADKTEKLLFFKKTKLWYLNQAITIDAMIPPRGVLWKLAKDVYNPGSKEMAGKWNEKFALRVCSKMEGAP